MTRDEMISMVKILCQGGGDTEDEDYIMINKLRSAVPHAKISDLIFYDSRNLPPERIVDEAIKRELDFIEKFGSGKPKADKRS